MRKGAWFAFVIVLCGCPIAGACSADDSAGGRGGDANGRGDDGGGASGDGGLEAVVIGPSLPQLEFSGTRLEARHLETPDGTRVFIGWHDKKLDTPCSFGFADDGKLRCMPPSAIREFYGAYEFKDSACTQPIVTISGYRAPCTAPPPPPRFAVIVDGTQCTPRHHAFALGAKGTLGAYERYTQPTSGEGDCLQSPSGAVTQDYYDVGPEVAPTEFVAVTDQRGPAPDGVAAVMFTAEDGAHGFLRFDDAVRGATCRFGPAGDDRNRCVPESTAAYLSHLFSDAACTHAGAFQQGQACPKPAFAVELEVKNRCEGRRKVYATGSTVEPYYAKHGETCVAEPYVGAPFYAVTGEISATSFLEATPSPLGSSRLKTYAIQVAGGVYPTTPARMFDTQVGEPCAFRLGPGDVMRCLPLVAASEMSYFEDEACTRPLAIDDRKTECQNAPFTIVSFRESSSCGVRIFKIAKPSERTRAFFNNGGRNRCMPVPLPSLPAYELGAELPLESFVPATEVTQ